VLVSTIVHFLVALGLELTEQLKIAALPRGWRDDPVIYTRRVP
jgi:hypothetical protein